MGWFSRDAPGTATSYLPKQTSHEEAADKDLQNFFQQIQSASKPTDSPKPTSAEASNSTINTQTNPSSLLDPISESLLPNTMSCRAAFDSLFYCYSLGGQFNNVYRYGEMRNCSEQWSDFWFCMRTRSGTEGSVKGKMIQNHYREKERQKYGIPGSGEGRSSEDVWRGRAEKLPHGEIFGKREPGFEDGKEAGKGRVAKYIGVDDERG